MNASDLSPAQHRALAVLAAAHVARRPCRASNRTSNPTEVRHREMLTVQRQVADALEAAELAWYTNPVLLTLELTDIGRALAREVGW